MVPSKGTTESHKLTSAQQPVTILSGVVTSPFPTVTVDGLSCTQNAVRFTNVPNDHLHMNSDICNSSSLLHFNATQLPLPLGEFFILEYQTPYLAAKMTSPGVRWSRIPLFSVWCLSLTLPPHPSKIKHTVP